MASNKDKKDKKSDPRKTRPMKGPCPVCNAKENEECYPACPIFDPHDPFAF